MWWFVLVCWTLVVARLQNVEAQSSYGYDSRYDFNRRSYAAYPSYIRTRIINPSVYQFSNSASRVIYPSANTVNNPSNTPLGVAYPSNTAFGVAYPNTNTPGERYPGNVPNAGTVRVFTSAAKGDKVNLDVYYETNCPDSMRFIVNQLSPTFRDLEDIVDVRLIPFGKAQALYDPTSNKYEFQCHHGFAECYGNTVQGCAISLYPDVETHLNFISCMESYPRPSDSGQKCARRQSLDWRKISKCADGEEGKQILFRNGELTKSLQPAVTFVPWININKVHTDSIQRNSLRNLKSVICDEYKRPHPKC
ncbi:GILT-like protein 1 [Caerostris extrusa]|uniref:GILT-like protein 1 n=1 Tax=Caerostris extrusa TaxID=172846 RepID=A0AAV4VZX6_CAEEX|nr:GILT-like protein 1 [Caerostris extrusa]